LTKTKIYTKDDGTIIMDQFESDQASKSKTTPKSESIPNQKQHKYKIKTKLKILTGCLCAALLVSISFNIYFAISSSEINSLRYENLQLNEKYIQLTIDYNGLNNSYESLNKQAVNTVSQEDYNILKEKNQQLENELAAVNKKYTNQQEEIKFYKNNAVICTNTNQYYHTYSCEDWNRNDFMLANYNNALTVGFKPCPKCNPPQ
jgi:hypothetical protein